MSKARERRKAMLGRRLEPIARTTLRVPYDGSMAKSGAVSFVGDSDEPIVQIIVFRHSDGRLMVMTTSAEDVTHVENTGTPQ